jgi:hypothetical protein
MLSLLSLQVDHNKLQEHLMRPATHASVINWRYWFRKWSYYHQRVQFRVCGRPAGAEIPVWVLKQAGVVQERILSADFFFFFFFHRRL